MLRWLRKRRRVRYLRTPTPDDLERVIARSVGGYERMHRDHRQRLRDLTRVFMAEKMFEGGSGFTVTEEVRQTVAAQACLLLAGFDLDPARDPVYPNVTTIIVYASGYENSLPNVGPGGVVTEGRAHLGEAWSTGPVIVAWRHAKEGAANHADGRNLVLHEFAHKLDMLDGIIDGTPPLKDKRAYESWREVMTTAFEDLRAGGGHAMLLNAYGATNPGEFFAVATECFFERGAEMRAQHPDLYATLKSYYRQDTAVRQG